jgi:hypothetical protein
MPVARPYSAVVSRNSTTRGKDTLLVSIVFAALVIVEWRFRSKSVRVGTATFSLLVLLFARPSYTTAARRVSVAPPEARVTQLHGSKISEYQSGVATMYKAMDEAGDERANIRVIAVGVLFGLACSPVLRRVHRPSSDGVF